MAQMHNSILDIVYKSSVAGIFLFWGLAFTSQANAQTPPQDTDPFISKCSWDYVMEADTLRKNKEFASAITILKNGLNVCPDDPGLYWRLALNNLEWGDNQYNEGEKADKNTRLEYFEKGLFWAQKSMEADTLNRVTHAPEMMSTAYAAIISISGIKRKANLADSVRIYAEKAINIDPDNDRAYHILGRWHYEVSRLSWLTRFLADVFLGTSPDGSIEESIAYFKEAIKAKNAVVHHYWLGSAYLRKGEKEKALEQFQLLLEIPDDRHNDDYFKEQAQQLIEKLS